MPKSSANVPHIEPSIDRLSLTAEVVRDNVGPAGDKTGFCCGLLCFEAEGSSATFCHTVCFEAEAQGTPGWGGPTCFCSAD